MTPAFPLFVLFAPDPDIKKPAGTGPDGLQYLTRDVGQASVVTALVRRENFRLAVFLCSTPLATPRCSSG